jgi:hypothetical protein
VHDPTGKQIHHANAIQDDEISVDAHGVKVGPKSQCILCRDIAASAPTIGNSLLREALENLVASAAAL